MARDLYTDLGSNLDIVPVKSRIWMFELREHIVLQRESLVSFSIASVDTWVFNNGCKVIGSRR